jgi:D-inositol-3-phosphate glycosyltransferase
VAIGTLDSGAEDAIVEGESGRLVAQDVDAVEGALREVLDDDALRARLAKGARSHAEASSWDENARRVLEIYDGVRGAEAP